MAQEILDRTGMRPRIGQDTITLPITFDYQGGRREKEKTAKVWAVVLGVLEVIFFIGFLFRRDSNLLVNLLMSFASLLLMSSIIRFLLLKEGRRRIEKIQIMDTDGVIDVQKLWGIYDIGEVFPYVCRFRSGKSGVFVQLNKDVILGKYTEAEFGHYEAIGDAYNIAASSNTQICHIDYMDVVGSDERLDSSFSSLDKVSNPDLKDLLTDIYTYQQEQMSHQIVSFDTYLFLWSGSDESAWLTIQRILSCFMDANYRSYHVLDRTDLRELAKNIYLFEEFSVEDAMLRSFAVGNSTGIIPIQVEHSDGTLEKLNKTSEEKAYEAELAAKREQVKKEMKQQKKKKGSKNEDSIDLF